IAWNWRSRAARLARSALTDRKPRDHGPAQSTGPRHRDNAPAKRPGWRGILEWTAQEAPAVAHRPQPQPAKASSPEERRAGLREAPKKIPGKSAWHHPQSSR